MGNNSLSTQPRVHSLWIYPLKSALPCAVDRLIIDDHGPLWDREWMLVDEHHRFMTLRTEAKLFFLKTELTEQTLTLSWLPEAAQHGIHIPDQALHIPLHDHPTETLEVKVFAETVSAHLYSPDVQKWFCQSFQRTVNLVRAKKLNRYGRRAPNHPLRFPDGYPFLLLSQASLDELSQRLGWPVEAQRFRPNILITGTAPHAEDQWQNFNIGEIAFTMIKHCTRCVVIEKAPQTGQRSPALRKSLLSYRKPEKDIIFGVNLIHHNQGQILVGDELIF